MGNLIQEKAANGQNVTSYVYDSQNRVTKMTDPMGMSETYSYDTAGNMVTKVDRNGTTLRYDYDGMNRLTKEYARVGNSEVFKSTYSYNCRNNLIKISNDNTSIEFYYGFENLLAYTYIYQNGKEYQINLVYDKGDNIFIKRLSQYVESKYFDEMKLTYIYAYDKNNKLLREEKYVPDDDRINITDYFYYNNGNIITGNK